jgi:hypothetical protein
VVALAIALAVGPACMLLNPPESKVRSGELFEVAHEKYDPYFREVHILQKQKAGNDDQKASARRALVDVLKLDPDVADVTLIQATHERVLGISREAGNVRLDVTEGTGHVVVQNSAKVDDASRNVFSAIETCVRAESDRAKALREIPTKADTLSKQGHALEPQVQSDLGRRGARAPKQVQEELTASYEVLNEVSKSSRLQAREAEDFIADLRRAVGADIAESAARPSASASASAKPAKEGKESKPPKSKPASDSPSKSDSPPPRRSEPKPERDTPKPAPEAKAAPEPKPEKPAEAPKPKPPPKDDFNP